MKLHKIKRIPGGLPMAFLNGVKEIVEHVGYSESTVMKWIEREGLPAGKIGGSWISETEMIDQWRAKRIVQECKEANAARW